MNNKSMCRAWVFGSLLSLSVALASCNGPVPAGTPTTGGTGTGTGSGSGSGSGSGEGSGAGTGTKINLETGPTSTRTSTGTEVTEPYACAVSKNDATKQADILLVLDRSSSMKNGMDINSTCDTGGGRGGGRRDASATTCRARWDVVQETLRQVLAGEAGSLNWGLLMFSSPGEGSCMVSANPQVQIGAGNGTEILTQIGSAGTETSTPTRKAVNAGVKYLQGLTGPEPKSILLATDGQPNCATDETGTSGNDEAGTSDAIAAALAAGFKVYVLGIGPETNAATLNDFAKKGGTDRKDVSGPGKDYYAALSAEELSKQFESIVGSVASCTFRLAPPKNADLSNVVVEFDGDKNKRATRDTTRSNGWDFTADDNTVLQVYGPWCDGLMNGTYKSAKVLIGCKDQPIP